MGILRDGLIFGVMIAIIVLAFNIFYLKAEITGKDIVLAFIQYIVVAWIVFWFLYTKPGEAEAGHSAAEYAKAEVKKYGFFDKLKLVSIWRKLMLVAILVVAVACFIQPNLHIWHFVIGGVIFVGMAWYIIDDGFYCGIYLKKKKELMNKK